MDPARHFQVLIVGGGSGGLSVASRLSKKLRHNQVGVIEPSDKHYYQPLWTLVGGGAVNINSTVRSEAAVMPRGAEWIRDAVTEFDPEKNSVRTKAGRTYTYDFLVVAAGISVDWDKVKGLAGNVGREGICSNYSFEYAPTTWRTIQSFKGGDAIFTHPATPIKCGGAPQKIMYLADDAFRQRGVRDKTNIHFYIGDPAIFKVEKYAKALLEVVARKGLQVHYRHNLTELHLDKHVAVFQDLARDREIVQHWDMIHVTPPMSPPPFIKSSPFANEAGWFNVDKNTLRHPKWHNVYALGDCSSLPTSKTGAAIRKQAPIVAANLLAHIRGDQPTALYDGYTSCPLVTGYGKLILAEFDYDLKPKETFPFDQSKERKSMYLLKKHVLPVLYWKGMLKGRA
ncbi:MAG TPA: FAD/NAD(P)-binding oxidoreductase [Phycisphaerales bacterium]|nr:FAD/NAD(P)-binding oxidoreductase [Phycisphaerales bacterium]